MADYFGISKSSLIDNAADGFVAGSVHYEVTSLTAHVYGRYRQATRSRCSP